MSWIKRIGDGISAAFRFVRKPLANLPPLFLLCEAAHRPGLSAMSLAASIIRRLPEAGIETGVNPDGSPNKVNEFVRIISEEIVNELKNNAKITCTIAPSTITSVGTGANAGGPVVVTSLNTLIMNITGIMQ